MLIAIKTTRNSDNITALPHCHIITLPRYLCRYERDRPKQVSGDYFPCQRIWICISFKLQNLVPSLNALINWSSLLREWMGLAQLALVG